MTDVDASSGCEPHFEIAHGKRDKGISSNYVDTLQLRLTLELCAPSDIQFIEGIVALIQKQCSEVGFPSSKCTLNIPVALSEALANAILRANKEDPGKQVYVRSALDSDRLVIEIRDEGPGFDLRDSLRDPTLPENITREDGRGLFLMTHLMDRIELFNNNGNVVRMTLNRHAETE